MKIDIHTHILPEHCPDLESEFGYGGWISLDHASEGTARMMKNGECFRIVECNCWDPLARINDCDDDNVDIQVLSTVPVMFSYWAESKHTHKPVSYTHLTMTTICS